MRRGAIQNSMNYYNTLMGAGDFFDDGNFTRKDLQNIRTRAQRNDTLSLLPLALNSNSVMP
jgi:hypothetical protein